MKWLPVKDNDADLFTKNLNGPAFERFAQIYVGVDDYSPDLLGQEGVGS